MLDEGVVPGINQVVEPIDTLDEVRILVLEIAAVVLAHPPIEFCQKTFNQGLSAWAGGQQEICADDFSIGLGREGVTFRVRRHIQIDDL
ncbi:hypothetical protein D9M71_342810 [compost metagenome]